MPSNTRMSISEIMALAESVDARMEDNPPDPNAGADQTGNQNNGNQGNPGDYPEGLGDAGKRAIDRMKAERDEAVRKQRESDKAFADFKAANTPATGDNKPDDKGEQKTDGKTAEQVESDLIKRLTEGALRSTVREVAGAKLTDPEDALVLGNWSDLTPNQFGEYDRSAITAKIDELTKAKPYLLKKTNNFQGGADNGQQGEPNNNNANAKSQLSRDDLKTMSPLEINKARVDGRLKDLLTNQT